MSGLKQYLKVYFHPNNILKRVMTHTITNGLTINVWYVSQYLNQEKHHVSF